MENKKNILVVEDDSNNRNLLFLILKKDYNVFFATNDTEFYEQLSNNLFDLIIMDIQLGIEKTGLDLIKELRQMEKHSKIPVICLTANAFLQNRSDAYQAGADEFIAKPVEIKILRDKISKLINKNS